MIPLPSGCQLAWRYAEPAVVKHYSLGADVHVMRSCPSADTFLEDNEIVAVLLGPVVPLTAMVKDASVRFKSGPKVRWYPAAPTLDPARRWDDGTEAEATRSYQCVCNLHMDQAQRRLRMRSALS